jgi:hypothetical protein
VSEEENLLISTVYMKGLRAVFMSYAFLLSLHVVICVFIEDYGLKKGVQPLQSERDIA